MNTEQERTEFEAWYRLHHGSRDVYGRDASGEYADKQVQGAFNVWQARAALTAQDEALLRQAIRDMEAADAVQPAAVDGAIDRARFEVAPCYLCGYNGPGYYRPDTHPCAAKYHAVQEELHLAEIRVRELSRKALGAQNGVVTRARVRSRSHPGDEGTSMTDHWCKYCNGVNTHNCQFNPNLPRTKIYTNTVSVSGDEALLRQALEALEFSDWYTRAKAKSTIAALRERLGEKA